ncbi:hypothetical protein [Ruegeria sp.]|uniref:hypothetical protein n=1 Tax=Ruegeria sp. TaxID=1879320 RepID=UPI003C7E7E78
MVQNNKVLTVSYGTFSCTLEGFDDSFETMKAIAEYFRDLAADDRYFGSEPPQPDAEMLTRIAQRDIARKVEASQKDSGLLLRATDTAAAAVPTPPAPPNAPVDAVPSEPAASPAEVAPADNAAADSIAAKLQRIRAVVSHSNESAAQYGEDVDTGYIEPAKPPVDAIAEAFAAGALDPADLAEENSQDASADAATEEPAIDEVSVDETEVEAHVEVEDEVAEASVADEVQDVAEMPESIISSFDVPTDEYEEEETVDLEEVKVSIESAFEQDEDTLDEILALTGADKVEEEPAQPEVTSEDVMFAEDDGAADEDIRSILEEDSQVDDEPLTDQNVLSAEDEADLLEEISLVEAELTAHADQVVEDANNLDEDVSRLMDSADARMDDPATNDQRETYSHLRTAVAATEAERETSDENDTEDAEYRGDLASVVSPRRPEVAVTSTRPRSDSPAPLKLVAEQRVDTDSGDTGPVTPRRVQSDMEGMVEEGGFASFAQEQGAQSLSDLLEAAAAYLSFIEGQEQFSRPQLMNKVRSLKPDEFDREESLRSFGQLLRDGKIEKAGGGRFAASTEIGFRPDDKRAAG